MDNSSYYKAQYGLTLLKDAIRDLLVSTHPRGLRNVDVGKALVYIPAIKGMKGIFPEHCWR